MKTYPLVQLQLTGEAWAAVDIPSAKLWAQSLDKADGDIAWVGVITSILRPDFTPVGNIDAAAKEFSAHFSTIAVVQAPEANNCVQNLASRIAGEWVKQGKSEKALEWILTFPDSSARDDVAAFLFREWASSDAMAVAKAAEKLQLGSIHDHALAAVCEELAKKGEPAVGLKFTDGIKNAKIQSDVFQVLAEPLARLQPDNAFKISQRIEDAERRERVLSTVFATWLQMSPQTALDALNTLPGDEKQHVLALMKEYAEHPPRRAIED